MLRRIAAPVPAGTVLFITRAWVSSSGSAPTTASTRERSASPEYVGGVSTQQNSSRGPSRSSGDSVVNVSRSRLRSSSSRPGSWIGGVSPARSVSIFSALTSIATTRWPSSAKHAAVTSPTQPTPITPIAGFS